MPGFIRQDGHLKGLCMTESLHPVNDKNTQKTLITMKKRSAETMCKVKHCESQAKVNNSFDHTSIAFKLEQWSVRQWSIQR